MEQNVNWGIIGLGWISHKFAEGLKHVNNARLFAVASRDIKKANKFKRKYDVAKAYGNYDELIDDPDVDIVYIATPHIFHCENTIMCLRKKKAVLCEKPLAMNLTEVKLMIECAKKNNVFLMEALWTKFLPHIDKAVEIIRSGELGEVSTMTADFGFKANYKPEGRLFNIILGGGSLLDIGIYPIFLALHIFGKPHHVKAMATFGETGVDENCGILFKYNDGKMANLQSTLLSNTLTEAHFFGTKATLKIGKNWFAPNNLVITDNFCDTKTIKIKSIGNGYNYEAAEATRCILEGKKESKIMSLDFSLELMRHLDQIRDLCGIAYPSDY